MLLFALTCIAFSAENAQDSIKTYRLGDINVTGYQSHYKVELSKYDVQYYEIQRADANSFSQLQMLIPSARIRINSRGESMLFLRGAGERQLGLFFDGVQMNIPWDNRFDLTFIPTDVIGKLSVNKNAGSILYGPNVLGGAVNITTMERINDGYGLNVKLLGENTGSINGSITTDGQFNGFNYIANISYLDSKGSALSKNVPDSVMYQNKDDDLVINSDLKRMFAYIRGEYKLSDLTTTGISVSYLNGEKGVIPENHNSKPRFWRYPELNKTLITLNFEHLLSSNSETSIRGTFWYDNFNQTINDYKDSTFSMDKLNQVQKDEDGTIGGRLAFQYQLMNKQYLTAVFNGFTSKHKEIIKEELNYSQTTINTGLDYNGEFGPFNINAGIGYDRNETPETGIYKENEGFTAADYAAFLSVNFAATDNFGFFGNISRRTRFATMRESYSGALNKFKANPDLKAESGILSEIGAYVSHQLFNFRISAFSNNYSDMITQITLTKELDSLKRKMRINVGTASIYGLDLSLRTNPWSSLFIDGNFTYMLTSGEQNGIDIEHFDNKPELLGGLSATYKFSFFLELCLEMEMTGKQWETIDLANNKFAEIDASTTFNFRASYMFTNLNGVMLELFARMNNIFDEYRLSQRGIPEPGRTIVGGLSLKL